MRKLTLIVIVMVTLFALTSVSLAQEAEPFSARNFGGTDIIVNGGFEDATGWTASSDDGAVVLCTTSTCDVNDKQGPNTGDGFTRLGSAGADTEASLSQTIVIPEDHFSVLTFKLWLGDPDLAPGLSPQGYTHRDYLDIKIDNTYFAYSDASQLTHQYGYTSLVYDLSAYADGKPHTITFIASSGMYDEVPSVWSLDDIALYVTPATDIIVNGGFETETGQPSSEGWKLPPGAKVKCNKANKTLSKEGNCALQVKIPHDYILFTSQKVKDTQLSQTIAAGDILSMSNFRGVLPSTNGYGSTYMSIKFTYDDGSREKVTLAPQISDVAKDSQYKGSSRASSVLYHGTINSYLYALVPKNVTKMKIQLQTYGFSYNYSGNVKLYVDDVKVLHVPRSAAPALLPLPSAP